MFRSTEAAISTLYASTIYTGNLNVSTLDIVGGDLKISNGSSIFDIFVGPSSVTQSLNVDGNTIGQLIVDVSTMGLKFIDSDETRYTMAASSLTIHNPLAQDQLGPTARYGVQEINFSTVSSSVDMYLGPATFETSLTVQGNQAGIIAIGSNIVLQDISQTSYIFGSTLKMHDNKAEANPTGIYDPSSIVLSTFQSLVKIEQDNITLSNTSTSVNQFLGNGAFETSLTNAGDTEAILTLASTTVLKDNYETSYSFGSSNFIIHNNLTAGEPTVLVSPSSIFISSISSIINMDDRNIDFLSRSSLLNIFASPDENYAALTYASGGEQVGQIIFNSSFGGVQISDSFANNSYFASNAFTTTTINADNITTRTLTAKSIRVISTIYSESTISTVVLLADSADISSLWGQNSNYFLSNVASNWALYPAVSTVFGGAQDLSLVGTRFMNQTATGFNINSSNGDDVINPGFYRVNVGGGNYGEITMNANPGFLGNYGRIGLTANGGTLGGFGIGGLVEITANTPVGTLCNATSAIKFSASGINSYAGAIPSIGSLAGYNFIYGNLGVNICAGIPSIVPNIPLTTFLYGTAGVVIGSDMYASAIYGYWAGIPYAPSNLLLAGRTTVAGNSFVVLSNVSSINGQAYPPPSSETISTFNDASISSLTVSSINGEQYPPNIESLSTFQNIYVASTIQVASSISFVLSTGVAVGVIDGVSSINNVSWPPEGLVISSFSTIFVSTIVDGSISTNVLEANQATVSSLVGNSLSTNNLNTEFATVSDTLQVGPAGQLVMAPNSIMRFEGGISEISFISTNGAITGVSSINNTPYPPPPADQTSTFSTLTVSSFVAGVASTNMLNTQFATVSDILQVGPAGELVMAPNSIMTFEGGLSEINFVSTNGVLTGVSSINNVPYPPPPADQTSTFSTLTVSSFVAGVASTLRLNTDIAFVTDTLQVGPAGELVMAPNSIMTFEGGLSEISFISTNGVLTGVSSVNNVPYPPPAGDAVSSFLTASISSLTVSSINNLSPSSSSIPSSISNGAGSINIDAVGAISSVTGASQTYAVHANQQISLVATAIGLDLWDSDGGARITMNGSVDVKGTEMILGDMPLYVSTINLSSINNAAYPPPASEVISTFQTASISSLNASTINASDITTTSLNSVDIIAGNIAAQSLTAASISTSIISTGQVSLSSLNGYGFSTLSQWNVAPSGYDVTVGNNQFYVGQEGVFHVVSGNNDRFMLIGGNSSYALPSTMISSVLTPGNYSFSTFGTMAVQSISTAVGQATYQQSIDPFIFADIILTSNLATAKYGLETSPGTYNYAIANGLAFFSSPTGYGIPNVPYSTLSKSALLFGVPFGSTLQNPPEAVYPSTTYAALPAQAQTATVLTMPVHAYGGDEFVSTMNGQISNLIFPFNQMTARTANQSTNQFGVVTSQSIVFDISPDLSTGQVTLGLNFTNSSAYAGWNLGTVSEGNLNEAQALLAMPSTTLTMNNYGGPISINGDVKTFGAVSFGSNMEFNTADVLGFAVSSINQIRWETVATQNGIGSNFTITPANNQFIFGQSNIHNVVADYNDRFGLTAFHDPGTGFVSTQVTCIIPAGVYYHEEFVSTVNYQISTTQSTFRTIWPSQNGPFEMSISSVSTIATHFELSQYLQEFGAGITFTQYGQNPIDAATLAVMSTTGPQFGSPTPSTFICNNGTQTLQPTIFPDYSQAGSAIIASIQPATYDFTGLVAALVSTTTTLPFPYDTTDVTGLSITDPDGSVIGGEISFRNTTSSNLSYFGFSANPLYPFARGVTGCNLSLTASTLGFTTDQAGFIADNFVPATGAVISGVPSYFGSNMQFNTAIVSSFWASTVNGKLGESLAFENTAATFSSLVVSSIGTQVLLADAAIIFNAEIVSLVGAGYGLPCAISNYSSIQAATMNTLSLNASSINGSTYPTSSYSNLFVSSLTVSEGFVSTLTTQVLSSGIINVSSLNVLKEVSQIASTQQLFVSSINGSPYPFAYYASFIQTSTITQTAANTPTRIPHNVTEINNSGYSLDASGNIVISATGVYKIDISVQFSKIGGGIDYVTFWFRKNGVDIPQSGSQTAMTGNDSEFLAAVGVIFALNAGDVISILFASAESTMKALAVGIQTAPFACPAIPSIITNIFRLA